MKGGSGVIGMNSEQKALIGFETAFTSWKLASDQIYSKQTVFIRQAFLIASNAIILTVFGLLIGLPKSVDPIALRFVLIVGMAYSVLWSCLFFGGLHTERHFRNFARECAIREMVVHPADSQMPALEKKSVTPCVILGVTIAVFFALYVVLFFVLPILV